MAFFSPSSHVGQCVYYSMGVHDEIGASPGSLPTLPSNSWLVLSNRHGRGKNGQQVDIRPHCPTDNDRTGISSQCLVLKYQKDISICERITMIMPTFWKVLPTDSWLHAVDIDTCPHPQAIQIKIKPQCRDVACFNYYRRLKDCFRCKYRP